MEFLDLTAATAAAATLRLPGSKSISNRSLLLAALARGTTELRSLLDSDDTKVMREALVTLGITLHAQAAGFERTSLSVTGCPGGFPVKRAALFLGNAGTAFRPLAATLALSDGHYELSGVPRMHERPIGDLVDALRGAGAHIDYGAREGYPPIAIGPRERIPGAPVRVRGDVSSQFLSSLLMALGATGEGARVEVEGELISRPYVELTLGLMRRFGVEVACEGWSAFEVPSGSAYLSPGVLEVEGDASSASYFLAAGLAGGGPVRVEGVGRSSLQGDVAFSHVLEAMGGTIAMGEDWIEARGPGKGTKLRAFDLDMNRIPDAAMTAAVLALYADGRSVLRNIASWRVKETDRIAAMAAELRKFGAKVEEGADFIAVTPPPGFARGEGRVSGDAIEVETYDDHRMAMSFALAAFGPRPVRILDPKCVAKTFPDFFAAWSGVVRAGPR